MSLKRRSPHPTLTGLLAVAVSVAGLVVQIENTTSGWAEEPRWNVKPSADPVPFGTGALILLATAALGLYPTYLASLGRTADRRLAAASGVFLAASVVALLALVGSSLAHPPRRDFNDRIHSVGP